MPINDWHALLFTRSNLWPEPSSTKSSQVRSVDVNRLPTLITLIKSFQFLNLIWLKKLARFKFQS